MNPEQIERLVKELRELSELHDASFVAPTQSRRVCREAAEAIEALCSIPRDIDTLFSDPGNEADMFWLAADPERPYDNPGDYFTDENVFGEPVEFQRAIQRSDAWGVAIPTKRDDDDIVEDFDLHWFNTEAEAQAFCEANKRGEGLPLIDAGQ